MTFLVAHLLLGWQLPFRGTGGSSLVCMPTLTECGDRKLLDPSFSSVYAKVPLLSRGLSTVQLMAPRPRGQSSRDDRQNKIPINDEIPCETVRVMLDNPGQADDMLGVMAKDAALAEAESRELDLVLISPKSDPPVCKIISYDKYRFAMEKKKKEQSRSASKGQELKELKLSSKIAEHDYDVRRRAAEKFLLQGNKVKFSIQFKGREIAHADVGLKIMQRMAASLEEIGVLEGRPKVMGRQMIMLVGPKVTVPGKD